MQPYLNVSGDSGIVEYENRPDSIIVRFRKGDLYVYPLAAITLNR